MINMCDLSGKIYLVTGASSGIGREVSIAISRMGGRVLLTGRNENGLAETLECMDNPEVHHIEIFDLKEVGQIGKWIKDSVKRLNVKFDGMVYAAGVYMLKPLIITDYSDLKEVMDINYFAAVCLLRHMSQGSVCNKGSSYVFVSSISGESGEKGLLSYSASKAALNCAVKSAALELARSGHRVNAIAPGTVDTKMFRDYIDKLDKSQAAEFMEKFPLGIGKPSDVANMAIFLLSDSTRWVTGTTINVDGGYSIR